MDVHQATISVAVMEGRGSLIMECILETKAATILDFIRGLHGSLSVTFEREPLPPGCIALKSGVAHLVVCDPRKNPQARARLSSRALLQPVGWSLLTSFFIELIDRAVGFRVH